jgi:transposase-like protein
MSLHTTDKDTARMIRGQSIIEHGISPIESGNGVYTIRSQKGKDAYTVTVKKNVWACTCYDYTYRHMDCKHIHAVRFWKALKERLTEEQEQEQEDATEVVDSGNNSPACPYCGSARITKCGTRKTKIGSKSRMTCKDCKRFFTVDNERGFEGMHVTARVITVALDLYFKSTSLRKIVDHIDQFYDCKIHHTTILFWVKKYGKIISDYAETLTPQLGNMWHADEMMLKIKKRDEYVWLWNVMDGDTRYLISNLVSKKRGIEDATRAFHRAKMHSEDKPELMITDGLPSYPDAFNREFYDNYNKSEHVASSGLRSAVNNNRIERFHNTVRERNKIMRGLCNRKTATTFNNTYKAYYNHIRVHTALDGKTPAQAAGIKLGLGRNRWKGMIQKAYQ